MKRLGLVCSIGFGLASLVHAANMPIPGDWEQRNGAYFRIGINAAARLTNAVERTLYSVKIPEVIFAQANIHDVVAFLNKALKAQTEHHVAIMFDATGWGEDASMITFAAKNVSVLEVIRAITMNVGIMVNLTYTIDGNLLTIRKKR